MGRENLALVGFDAGDTLRSSDIPSGDLQVVNIFRIDGKDDMDVACEPAMLAKSLGNCVTGIESGEVCGLNSVSTGCSTTNNLVTADCLCNPGVTGNSNSCRGK